MLLQAVVVVVDPLCETEDIGVCGGVLRGRVGGCAEWVAVTRGTDPSVGVGLLITEAEEAGVAVLDRAGLAGGITWTGLG